MPRRTRWALAALLLLGGVLLLLSVDRKKLWMSEREKMDLVKAIPDRPRYMSFLLRSYAGSRQHLLIAARDLLALGPVGGDEKEQRGSGELYIMEAQGNLREHLMGVFSVQNEVSIEQALARAKEVENLLADAKAPGARETVRIELIWVQGVKLELPDLTLPSPEIDGDSAVMGQFEDTLRAVAKSIWPEERDRQAMRAAYERAPLVQWHRYAVWFNLEDSLAFYRKPGHNEWEADAPDRPELLALAARAVGVALMERLLPRNTPEKPVDPKLAREIAEVEPQKWSEEAMLWNSHTIRHGREAEQAQLKLQAKMLVPVEVAVDVGATEETLFLRWVSEVQSVSREKRVRIGKVIVTAAGANRVRGAIVGEASEVELPGIRLLGLRLEPRRERKLSAYRLRLETGDLFGQPHVGSK